VAGTRLVRIDVDKSSSHHLSHSETFAVSRNVRGVSRYEYGRLVDVLRRGHDLQDVARKALNQKQ